MDVQAKDRLTGAVILVVLVVLLVPELLSGPGRKLATVASNASGEPPLRSYTLDLGDEQRTHHAEELTASTTAEPAPAGPQAAASAPAPTAAPAASAQMPPAKDAAASASRPPRESEPEAQPVTGWTVQLGSFANRVNAEREVRELKTKGFAAFVTESASGGRRLYRVRVGPVADRGTVQALAARLRAAGHPGSLAPNP